MKISGWYGFIFAVALLIGGCQLAVAKPAATAPELSKTNSVPLATNTLSLDGKWHSVKISPSSKLPKIHTYQKFNPVWWFENSDEPVPPEWYRPDDKHRVGKWHFRNSFHNFDFYVIGVADKKTVRSGRYPEKISNPNGGWNFAVSRRILVVLPFISYQHGKFGFYLGWRTRGNFGIKMNYSSSNLSQKSKPPATAP